MAASGDAPPAFQPDIRMPQPLKHKFNVVRLGEDPPSGPSVHFEGSLSHFRRLLGELEQQYTSDLSQMRQQLREDMGLSSRNADLFLNSDFGPRKENVNAEALMSPEPSLKSPRLVSAESSMQSQRFGMTSQLPSVFTSGEPKSPPPSLSLEGPDGHGFLKKSASAMSKGSGRKKSLPPLQETPGSSRRTSNNERTEEMEDLGLEDERNGPGPKATRGAVARCVVFLQSDIYELVIGLLIVANSLIMAVEFEFQGYVVGHSLDYPRMQDSPEQVWPSAQSVFDTLNLAFTITFLVDILVRIGFLRSAFFRQSFNWLDLLVVFCSVVEILFEELLPLDTVFIRLLRLGKVARAIRVVRQTEGMSSLIMLLKCVQASFNTLCWSLSFIVVLQCIAGMVISQVVSPYMTDESVSPEARRAVFRYYGTFTSTFLTMFEVLLANWAPPARILVDNVSNLWVYVFVVYRCVVGFAILNVVNAVFIQQTMRVAQADQELIIKQRIKAESAYASKMRQFFEKLDTHKSGFLTWKDFNAALQKPELRSWMATLDLETFDLVNLFHLIDDGDGQITVAEFLEGAIRLRGLAKSVDLAQVLNTTRRLDTKMEALCMAIKNMSRTNELESFHKMVVSKSQAAIKRRLTYNAREKEEEDAANPGLTASLKFWTGSRSQGGEAIRMKK